jgi:hypothetical protein
MRGNAVPLRGAGRLHRPRPLLEHFRIEPRKPV